MDLSNLINNPPEYDIPEDASTDQSVPAPTPEEGALKGDDLKGALQRPEMMEFFQSEAQAFQDDPDAFEPDRREYLFALRNAYADLLGVEPPTAPEEDVPETRPQAEVEDLSYAGGLRNSFMRGVNRIQGNLYELGSLAPDQDVREWFQGQADEEYAEAAAYSRGRRATDFAQEMRERKKTDGSVGAFFSMASEDPVGAIHYVSDLTAEAAPSLGVTMTAGAAAAATAPASIPVTVGSMFLAGTALETGAQLQDASTGEEGQRVPLGPSEKIAAFASGTGAGAVESIGGFALGRGLTRLLSKSNLDEAAQGQIQKLIGERMREYASGVIGERGANGAAKIIASRPAGVVAAGGTEGSTEVIQGLITDAGAKVGWDPERDIGETWFEEFLAGMTLGGGVSAAAATAGAVRERTSSDAEGEDTTADLSLATDEELVTLLDEAADLETIKAIETEIRRRVAEPADEGAVEDAAAEDAAEGEASDADPEEANAAPDEADADPERAAETPIGAATDPEAEAEQDRLVREESSVTVGDLVGEPVQYGEYVGTLRRDSEGAFVVDTGDAVVEVSDVQKDPQTYALSVGVESAPVDVSGRPGEAQGLTDWDPRVLYDDEQGTLVVRDEEGGETVYTDATINQNDEGVAVSVTGVHPDGVERTIRSPQVVNAVRLQRVEQRLRREVDDESTPTTEEDVAAEVEAATAEVTQDTDENIQAVKNGVLAGVEEVEGTLDSAYREESVDEADLDAAETWLLEAYERAERLRDEGSTEARQQAGRDMLRVLSGMDKDLTRARLDILTDPTRQEDPTQTEEANEGTDEETAPQDEGTAPESPRTAASDRDGDGATQVAEEGAARELRELTGEQGQPVTDGDTRPQRTEGEPAPEAAPEPPTSVPTPEPTTRVGGATGDARTGEGSVDLDAEPGVAPEEAVSGEAVSEEDVAAVQQLASERGLSSQSVDRLLESLEAGQLAPADVEPALAVADAVRSVEDAAAITPQHIIEGVAIQGQGGVRAVARQAADADERARMGDLLRAMDRAGEFADAQGELAGGMGERTLSEQEEAINARLESVERQIQAKKAELEARRTDILERMDRPEQGAMFGEESAPEQDTQMGFAGMEADTSTEGVKGALESDTRLNQLEDELSALQREYSRLSQEAEAAKRAVRRAQTKLELQEMAEELLTGQLVVEVPSGSEYTVGILTRPLEWSSENRDGDRQVKYRAPKGSIVVLNPKGTPVNRSSSNYLPALEAFLSDPNGRDQVDQMIPPVSENAPSDPYEYLRYVLEHSQNPFELARAYRQVESTLATSLSQVEQDLKEVGGFSTRSLEEQLEQVVGGSEDAQTYVGWRRGSDDPSSASYGQAIDVFVEGKPYTIEDVIQVIKDNPSGTQTILTEAEAAKRQIRQVFDDALGVRVDEKLLDTLQTAERVSRIRRTLQEGERLRDVEGDIEGANAMLERLVSIMETAGWTPAILEENASLALLSDRQKTAIQKGWEAFHSEPEEDAPFRRMGEAGLGVDAQTAIRILEAVVRSLQIEGIPAPVLVRSAEDLPPNVRARYATSADLYGDGFVQPGMTVSGETVYVIAEDVVLAAGDRSVADVARRVLLHEASHKGMRRVLGDSYTDEMARLFSEVGREEIETALGAAYAQEFQRPLTASRRALLADEYLAQVAEDLPTTNPSLFERIVLWLKRALAEVRGIEASKAEIEMMIYAAYDSLRPQDGSYAAVSKTGEGDVSFQRVTTEEDLWSADDDADIVGQVQFSRRARELPPEREQDVREYADQVTDGDLLIHVTTDQDAESVRRHGMDPSIGPFLESTESVQFAQERFEDGPVPLTFMADTPEWIGRFLVERRGSDLEGIQAVLIRPSENTVQSIGGGRVRMHDGQEGPFYKSALYDHDDARLRDIPAGVETGDWFTTEYIPGDQIEDVLEGEEALALRELIEGKEIQFSRQQVGTEQRAARLAPNGEPSNLNPVQYDQVRTEAFKEWFGDWENDPDNASKAVDENGEPLVLYHGTSEDFTVPRTGEDVGKRWETSAIYLSNDPVLAGMYAEKGETPSLMPVFANVRNPASGDLDAREAFQEINDGYDLGEISGMLTAEAVSELREQGYDGTVDPSSNEVTVFGGSQLKSATGNRGTFDAANPDIRFSRQQVGTERDAEKPAATRDTPEFVAAGRPALPDAPPPSWMDIDPETNDGKRLVRRIREDADGKEAGKRSIADMVVDLVFDGRFRRYFPSVSSTRGLDFSEPAQVIFGYLKDQSDITTDIYGLLERHMAQIMEVTQRRGLPEDAEISEVEAFQEWVRAYIESPGLVSDMGVTPEIERLIEEIDPSILKGLRDAARAYRAHRARTPKAQVASFFNDKGQGIPYGEQVSQSWDEFMFNLAARGHALHRAENFVWKAAKTFTKNKREGIQKARAFFRDLRGTEADVKPLYQSVLRVAQEVTLAIVGRQKAQSGLRISATESEQLSDSDIQELRDAGFEISDDLADALMSAEQGEDVWLTDKALSEIIEDIDAEDYPQFEQYALLRAEIARARQAPQAQIPTLPADRRRQLVQIIRAALDAEDVVGPRRQSVEQALTQYENENTSDISVVEEEYGIPIYDASWLAKRGFKISPKAFPGASDLTVSQLQSVRAEMEEANPDWVGVFDQMEQFADRVLLVSVAGGLRTAGEAAQMKQAYEAYLPLFRDIEATYGREGGQGGQGTGRPPRPSPGPGRASGSFAPSRPILQNMEDLTRQALDAYYYNRLMNGVARMLEEASTGDLPYQVKEVAKSVMTRIGRVRRPVAQLQPMEAKRLIADYLNREEGLSGEEVYTPEDITIDWSSKPIVRAEAPDGRTIIAPARGGDRVFYDVQDPILLDFFAKSAEPASYISRTVGRALRGMVEPWKRLLTQNFVFAIRNALGRDPVTAAFFGLAPEAPDQQKTERAKTLVPGLFVMKGTIERFTNQDIRDEAAASELLSRSFQSTLSTEHQARVEGWREVMREGVVIDGYAELGVAEKMASLPGQVLSALLKPFEMMLWATGQRTFSQAMEENTRLGAFSAVREAGGNAEQARMAYDLVSGNFGESPGAANARALYRSAGFLNPAVQTNYELWRRLFHPDPEIRKVSWAVRLGSIGAMTAVAWAVNTLITPDDRLEELDERPDEDKLTYMPIGGVFRVPFDYGIVGGAQAATWNLLENMAGRGARNKKALARIMARRVVDLPVHPTAFLSPQIIALIEAETNYVFYFDDAIEAGWMENVPIEDRHFSTTPGVYQTASKILRPISNVTPLSEDTFGPLRVRHMVRSGLTYQIDDWIRYVNKVSDGESGVGDIADDSPYTRKLWQREPIGWRSQSVQDVAKAANKYDALRQSIRELSKNNAPPERIEELMRESQDLVRQKQGMRMIEGAYQQVKQARKEGDYEKAKEWERKMTRIARNVERPNSPLPDVASASE